MAATARLFAEGATVPFIARYRKEATGSLDEVAITTIRDRLLSLAELDQRREAILKSLEERNLLTDELKAAIAGAETLTALEDIYLPYRPKRRTRATIAREKGLEPLADLLFNGQKHRRTRSPRRKAFVDADKERRLGGGGAGRRARHHRRARQRRRAGARADARAVPRQGGHPLQGRVRQGRRPAPSSRTTSTGASRWPRSPATACWPCAAARRRDSS